MKQKIKEYLCLMLTSHNEVNHSTIEDEGKYFRFHSTCRCGKQTCTSFPLHDNDLLADGELSQNNYPIEGFTSYMYQRQLIKYQKAFQNLLYSIFGFILIVISSVWYIYELLAYGGLRTNHFDTVIALVLALSITMNVSTYLKKRTNII